AGEAMPGGPVVLSWDAMTNDPAMNVVLHEFAHKLDMLNGAADGVPPLHAGLRGLLRRGGPRQGNLARSVCGRASFRVLRGDQRIILHRPARNTPALS